LTELRFDERAIIVTGAGRGVGRAHALLLASKGAQVVVADNGGDLDGGGASHRPADDVVREITEAGGRAVACHASVAEEQGARSIVDTAMDAYGRVDAVINNAGIHDPGLFGDLTVDQFRFMLDVHYLGTVFVTRAAWPHLVDSGSGRVVNTVSEAMLGGIPELSSYGAAKGAVFGLTRNLATEGSRYGIGVNAIAPRAYTRLSAAHSDKVAETMSMTKEVMDQINTSMPPDLCSPAAAFLAHPSCQLNGEVLQAGMGGVARIAVVCSRGFFKQNVTAEDIADNLEAIMDTHDATVTNSIAMSM
jgi:NAD(P)-dependent dehydrogenase (short-subunit alcohol dehydrogenase family)